MVPRRQAASPVCAAFVGLLALAVRPAVGQATLPPAGAAELDESGKVSSNGRMVSYRIRNLPVSSFPQLPAPVAAALTERGCVIPQTYEAKRPENVIHGSFEGPGSSDWAALCSVKGQVSLLVFFASGSPSKPGVLATAPAVDRLQAHDSTGELGFNWGIDAAAPRIVHDAQAGMAHRPPPPDHDSVADSTVDHKTVYHLYRNGAWEILSVE